MSKCPSYHCMKKSSKNMSANVEKKSKPAVAWYERVFESTDLECKDPELKPLLEVEKYPEWVVNVLAELSRQGLHLSPVKEMIRITPKRLGLLLGQKCANYYAIGNRLEATGGTRPEVVERSLARIEQMEKQRDNPVVASALQGYEIVGSLIIEMADGAKQFETIIHNAFKEALDQTNHAEAVLFFQGFARGIASPGYLQGQLSQSTEATPIYYRMFMHWPQVDKLGTVTELYDYLQKIGLSKQLLGDIDRLSRPVSPSDSRQSAAVQTAQRLSTKPDHSPRPPSPLSRQSSQRL